MATKCVTPEGRVSFPHVFQKHAFGDNKPRYSIELLFPKGTDMSLLERAVGEAIAEKWGPNPPKGIKLPFKDGDAPQYCDKDGYPDHVFIRANSDDKPPVVVGPDMEDLIDQSDLYGGCYAKVSVKADAYDVNGNRGVKFWLNSIWKQRDGERFGRPKPDPAVDFADVDRSAYGETVDSLL